MSDELAKSEAFMREVHEMYPDGQLDAYVAEYDRRGEAMKTLELGMLAGLLALGLDKETADRVGDRMRAIVGLGPDREPLPR